MATPHSWAHSWYYRQRTYLYRAQLCENLPRYRHCQYGDDCMFAHTLMDLQVPDEGTDGSSPWWKVWQKKKVHRWYGQPEMPIEFCYLLREYVEHHLANQVEVPDWAIGANALFNGIAPPWQSKQCDFNLAYDIEQLRIKRGGKLPPNVYPLSRFMRNMLSDLANEAAHAGPGGAEPESGSTANWSSWKCNTCGVWNYAWRDACYGCHAQAKNHCPHPPPPTYPPPPNWPGFLFG